MSTASTRSPAPVKRSFTAGASDYINDRTGIAIAVKGLGRKAFPDHWSFLLGEVALFSFVVILVSGTFLTFFFQASMTPVHYDGSYVPLKGVEMSVAMASTLDISFDIRGGLFVRQMHHWAALLFVAAIGLHMLRVFFTGAFRKPREINWLFGFTLFILALAEGFTGYSLPDDLLSGNGLRIIDGMVKGIPVIGTWTSFLIFGGEFPGETVVGRLYSLHILLLPALVVALIAVHVVYVFIHKHTQFAGPGREPTNSVGPPILPIYAAKAGGFQFLIWGVISLIAALFTDQPDLELRSVRPVTRLRRNATRLVHRVPGRRICDSSRRAGSSSGSTAPGRSTSSCRMIVIGIFIGLVVSYPFIEAWVKGDKREHHIADRPRNAPTRTAIGAAGVTFYAALWAAASSDILATHFSLTMEGVILALQATVIVGPFIAYFVTKRVCIALQKKDREIVLHGYESGRIVKLPGGEFIEVHQPLDEYDRWRLVSYESYEPLMLRPNARGKITVGQRLRASVSRWFFEDRIAPVGRGELEASHSAHH